VSLGLIWRWTFMCIPLSLLCKLFPHVSHVGKPTRIGKPMANKCYDTIWHYVPTNEQNKQMWWHDRTEAPHQRSSGLRKEQYKRFWTMLLHRGAWNDDRYLLMKTYVSARDHRTQRFDWHKRDIMPNCV
jgi:hypothetical protein